MAMCAAVVELAIPCARQAVADDVAGAHLDRCSAGVGGKRCGRAEPASVADPGEDFVTPAPIPVRWSGSDLPVAGPVEAAIGDRDVTPRTGIRHRCPYRVAEGDLVTLADRNQRT
jgi:hypothetical protein